MISQIYSSSFKSNFLTHTLTIRNHSAIKFPQRSFKLPGIPFNNHTTSISPIDGRYSHKCMSLKNFFSEHGLHKHRLLVEIEWFKILVANLPNYSKDKLSEESLLILNKIYQDYNAKESYKVKQIENKTNHDVKSIEYYLKDKLSKSNKQLDSLKELVHFAATSEDINNLAYALMLKGSREKVFLPKMNYLLERILEVVSTNEDLVMMSRTHGQPATPTTFQKEFKKFYERLLAEYQEYEKCQILGKMNGAVGNYTAHRFVYPEVNWKNLSEQLINHNLGLKINHFTTQIEPHDYMNKLFQAQIRFNNILDDMSKDIWGYISFDYITQKQKEGEIGSSTMPHKVNPINFENCEGNLFISNLLLNGMGNYLQTSRFQRDLTDSTVLRNLGIAYGHSLLAYDSFAVGLTKIEPNKEKMLYDLDNNWSLLAEPIQLIMKKHGIEGAYETLKDLTRGKSLDNDTIKKFIFSLKGKIPEDDYNRLMELTPRTYY